MTIDVGNVWMGKEKGTSRFWSFANMRGLAILISFLFAFRWSVAAPYHVPTPSMEPSIMVGDRIVGNMLAYNLRVPFTDFIAWQWAKPQKGEVVIFDSQTDPGTNVVKRVVAVEGDRVRFVDDLLYVNDKPQELAVWGGKESVMDDVTDDRGDKVLFQETLGGHNHWVMFDKRMAGFLSKSKWPSYGGNFVVPEGHVYVAGDNRHNSADSRFWGPLPIEAIYGRAERVIWSAWFPSGNVIPEVRFARFGLDL